MVLKPPPKNKEIEKCINKGAKVIEEDDNKSESFITSLRIPNHILKLIDQKIAERLIKISRNAWLLEAIEEKLRK